MKTLNKKIIMITAFLTVLLAGCLAVKVENTAGITDTDDNIEEIEYTEFENGARINFTQNVSKEKFTVDIKTVEYEHTIEVKNSDCEILINSQLFGNNFYPDFVKVLDLNVDGYLDLQIMHGQGTRNNDYKLYIYNAGTNDFIKIDSDNYLLSTVEVRNGYIYNWTNETPEIRYPEYFLIEGNKLVKKGGGEYEEEIPGTEQ